MDTIVGALEVQTALSLEYESLLMALELSCWVKRADQIYSVCVCVCVVCEVCVCVCVVCGVCGL